jgi:hypothetical protein
MLSFSLLILLLRKINKESMRFGLEYIKGEKFAWRVAKGVGFVL